MIKKTILLIFLIALLGFTAWFVYQNLPGEPKEFEIQKTKTPKAIESKESSALLFYPNIRFQDPEISYYVDESCSEKRQEKMLQAFTILQKRVSVLSFYPDSKQEADILITCSQEETQIKQDYFIAGEGGPTKIINTSLYHVILNGKILLYRESTCKEFPVVEVHELLHVFGFDHSNDPRNIMYNFSSCDQDIGLEIIETLNSLYSQKPLPDLYIEDIEATKKGRYLDFNIRVRNQGLINVENATLSLFSEDKEIDKFYLDEIGFGAGKIFSAWNIKLPSRNTNKITFSIDKENLVKEINEKNNIIELSVL